MCTRPASASRRSHAGAGLGRRITAPPGRNSLRAGYRSLPRADAESVPDNWCDHLPVSQRRALTESATDGP